MEVVVGELGKGHRMGAEGIWGDSLRAMVGAGWGRSPEVRGGPLWGLAGAMGGLQVRVL